MGIMVGSLEELDNTFNEFFSKIDSGEISKYTEYVANEFETYSNIIRGFFTGKENEIKGIYMSIRQKEFPFNKIVSPDINEARNMYMEYFKGMTEYMFKMTELKSSDEINTDSLIGNINKIRERDRSFVESIFGGEKNPPIEDDLNSTMRNVEVLIDVNSEFGAFKSKISNLINEYNSSEDIYKPAISSAISVYINSIRFYNYMCIKAILNCYNAIINSIQVRESANPKPPTPEYQIF